MPKEAQEIEGIDVTNVYKGNQEGFVDAVQEAEYEQERISAGVLKQNAGILLKTAGTISVGAGIGTAIGTLGSAGPAALGMIAAGYAAKDVAGTIEKSGKTEEAAATRQKEEVYERTRSYVDVIGPPDVEIARKEMNRALKKKEAEQASSLRARISRFFGGGSGHATTEETF